MYVFIDVVVESVLFNSMCAAVNHVYMVRMFKYSMPDEA